MVTQYFQKSNLGLTKSMNFFQNIIKPFKRSSNRGLEDDIERIAALEQKVFSFQVLVSATKNFHQTHKLGEGGFGPVFKGRLPDGRDIAVKRLAQASRHCRTLLRSYGDQLGIDSERVPRNASTRQFADAMAKAWLEYNG